MMSFNEPCLMQGSQEWKDVRKTKITATDAAICMGLNPYKDIFQLYEEKMDIIPEQPKTAAMLRGSLLEEPARLLFEKMTGITVFPYVVIKDWQMASLDGIDLDETHMVEIKAGGKKLHDMAKKKRVPPYYRCQMMHQLHLKPHLKEMSYFSYQPATLNEDGDVIKPEEGIIIEIKRDDDFIEEMVKAEWYLYECLRNRTPPKLTVMV